MNTKICLHCNKEFNTQTIVKGRYKDKIYFYERVTKNNNKFCSQKCYHLNCRGKPLTGKFLETSRKSIKKAIEARKNNPEIRSRWIQKMKEVTLGPKNHRWIMDRTKLVNQDERNCYKYVMWNKSVRMRDNYKCRIDNSDCCGKLEVHHILSWKEHPELHYQLNNGITLCHFHHPKVREEEKRLIPTFKELVSVSNE